MNNAVFRIAAILYGLVIAAFGANHLVSGAKMSGAVPPYMPSPVAWVYITGICMLLAAIAIILNVKSKAAAYLLALLLAIIIGTVQVQHFLHAADEAAKMMAMINTLKDTAMVAGALMVAAKGR
jgi:putative oxidoreductase